MESKDIIKFSNIDLTKLSNEQLDMVLAELEALSTRTPLDYVPHDKQLEFHNSLKKIRFLSGGNRSGKTEAGWIEALSHASGLYPEFYPEEAKIKRANRGRIIVEDYAKGCGEVLEPKIWKWLPRELVVSVRRTVKGFIEKVSLQNKYGGISTFDVLTHEQDDGVFEGWSGDWAWFDEPPPREKYIATLRGLIDFAGRCWITATPIKEPWLYDEIVLKQDPNTDYIVVDIRDNPYLKLAEILDFESRLREDEIEARIHGRFKHLVGRVYKDFDPSVHVIPESKIKLDRSWPVFFVCDPHDRKPHFGIWAKVDPFGTIYIFDEIKFKGTIQEFSREVLKREILNGIKPLEVTRILDPNKGMTPTAVTGLKLVEEFSKHALYFLTNVNDDITLGHLAVSERLHYNKSQPLSSTNHPKIYFIKDKTNGLVYQLLTYVWDEWRGAGKDSRDLKERPKDINKDYPDCIRYLCVFNPQYYDSNESSIEYKSNSITGYR